MAAAPSPRLGDVPPSSCWCDASMDTVLYLARLSKANIGEQAGGVGALEGRSGERRGHEEKHRGPLMSRGVAMREHVPLYSPNRAALSVCSSGIELQPRTPTIMSSLADVYCRGGGRRAS